MWVEDSSTVIGTHISLTMICCWYFFLAQVRIVCFFQQFNLIILLAKLLINLKLGIIKTVLTGKSGGTDSLLY